MSISLNRILISGRIKGNVPPSANVYWIDTYSFSSPVTGISLFDVSTDASNNIYVSGQILESSTRRSLLSKILPAGTLSWTRGILGGAAMSAEVVATSPTGNSVIAVRDGASQFTSSFHKYDTDGTKLWSRNFVTTNALDHYGMVLDSSENIYTSFRFGNSSQAWACFTKMDSSGVTQLSGFRRIGNGTFAVGCGDIDLDSSGNIYHAYNIASNSNAVVKYNTSGVLAATRRIVNTSNYESYSVSIDGSNNVYVFGLNPQQSAGSNDVNITKYDSSLNLVWTRQFGTTSGEGITKSAIDSSGNVYIASLVSATGGIGSTDILLGKVDPSGNLVWQRFFGTAGNDSLNNKFGLSLDANDNIILCFNTTIAKLPNDGSLTGTYGSYVYKVANASFTTPTFTTGGGVGSSTTDGSTTTAASPGNLTSPEFSLTKIDL